MTQYFLGAGRLAVSGGLLGIGPDGGEELAHLPGARWLALRGLFFGSFWRVSLHF